VAKAITITRKPMSVTKAVFPIAGLGTRFLPATKASAKEMLPVVDKPLVGKDPFAVLLADDLMVGQPPVMQQMVEQFAQWRASMLAAQNVPREHTNRYGIVSGQPVADGLVDVTGLV
jgi:UTP-glucose-1-phosphate uridylyltransferase